MLSVGAVARFWSQLALWWRHYPILAGLAYSGSSDQNQDVDGNEIWTSQNLFTHYLSLFLIDNSEENLVEVCINRTKWD